LPTPAGGPGPRPARHHACGRLILPLLFTALGGCGTTSSSGGLDKALELVGLQRPAPTLPDQLPKLNAQLPTKITVRLHAGEVLNTSNDGRSLSVVARLYKLRDRTAFEQVSYADLQDLRPPSGADWQRDVIESKELVLTPGQRFESVETVPPEAGYVAVVALFRAPAAQRWRFVFDTKSASQSGLTLGLHGCAMSVAAGQALNAAPEMTRLAGVRCP
jgi:type VI secretion system protein VasD